MPGTVLDIGDPIVPDTRDRTRRTRVIPYSALL